jgi:hypothetical protein
MSLGGLSGKHTFESFLDVLKMHHRDTGDEIRIMAYVSDFSPSELVDVMSRHHDFHVKELGDIIEVKVEAPITDEKTDEQPSDKPADDTYYCHYNYKNSLLLCFTTATLDVAEKAIGKFVRRTSRIFPLWIHPLTFDMIRRQIVAENSAAIITEFHARRYRTDGEDVIRAEYEGRYFKYMGDDGRPTLDEISRAYGVLPISIVFNILNVCKFRITHVGEFVFIHGDLDFLFGIINMVLSKVLETKKVIEKAKIEFIPVNMGKREIKLPKVIPVDIVFSREVDFPEMDKLIDDMSGEDFNFEIFDMSLIPGSIHLSGTILDRNKNIAFNITGNSDKITLSPRKDTNFDSMMQFYKMITEKLDLKAEVRIPTNQ